jgi:hypothetical protein
VQGVAKRRFNYDSIASSLPIKNAKKFNGGSGACGLFAYESDSV